MAKFWDPSFNREFNKKGIATAYVLFIGFLGVQKFKKKWRNTTQQMEALPAGFCWVKLRNDAS